jgi:hypothetical protein
MVRGGSNFMDDIYNIYCDESCHLEHDRQKVMVLGAIWCPMQKARKISIQIRDLKTRFGLSPKLEVKWTKISPAKTGFYLELVNFFFHNKDLHFRALVVPDKSKLEHKKLNQTHDDWYYKMYFDMLKTILSPSDRYHIYLDIKDTMGGKKIAKLHDVLCNNMYDFSREVIQRVQLVRSHESELLQLGDLLIGAVSSINREVTASKAKQSIISAIQQKSSYSLTKTTLLREEKFNLFIWHPREIL